MSAASPTPGHTTLVLTVIGDDRSGLVVALAEVIAGHGGNWDESHMAELAGKFAGLVQVTVPDARVDGFLAALAPLGDRGLLEVTAQVAAEADPVAPAVRVSLALVGNDQPGIVHEVATALAALGISIEELVTSTSSAPMSGDQLFHADAVLVIPADQSVEDVTGALEDLSSRLMVDIGLEPVADHTP